MSSCFESSSIIFNGNHDPLFVEAGLHFRKILRLGIHHGKISGLDSSSGGELESQVESSRDLLLSLYSILAAHVGCILKIKAPLPAAVEEEQQNHEDVDPVRAAEFANYGRVAHAASPRKT